MFVVLRNKEAEAAANAELAAEKQKTDAEKKRADAVLFEISSAVCRWVCRDAFVDGNGPTKKFAIYNIGSQNIIINAECTSFSVFFLSIQ